MSEYDENSEKFAELQDEVVALREQLKEQAFKLYERDVEAQVVTLTEKLGTHATSKAFATEFKRFMLNEGYSLTGDERAAVLKLCDLALKRGAVDMRSLGSSYDQETKRTVKLTSTQAKSQKQHTPEDELEVMDVAERIALSEGKIAQGEDLTSLKLSDREALIARAAKMTGWGAAN